jgi:hypothetical protein
VAVRSDNWRNNRFYLQPKKNRVSKITRGKLIGEHSLRIAAFVRTIISSQPFFWFITVLISGSFGIYLSTKSVTDPFLYYDTGFIKQTSEAQTFKFPENGPFSSLSLAPGRQVLMYQLSEFTGIAPEKLQFLPLGSIIVSSTLFLLCVVLVESPFLACLITVYLLLNLSHASSIYFQAF